MTNHKPTTSLVPKKIDGRRNNGGTPPKPFEYSNKEEIFAEVCDRLASGEFLHEICATPGMPHKDTLWEWRRKNEDFQRQYDVALLQHADAIVHDTIRIADEEENPHKAKVMIQARQWWASKLRPDKYGERIEVVTDKREGKEVDARIAKLLGQAGIGILAGKAEEGGGSE